MIKPRLLLCSVVTGLTAALLVLSGGSASASASAGAAVSQAGPAATSPDGSPDARVSPAATLFCEPGVWTQVHWYINPFWPLNYRYQVATGVFVNWRWFSGGVPPYWENSFVTVGDIWTPPSWFTSVEFMCSSPTTVVITPL